VKARLTDPKCMCLRWGKAIFDNLFARLKYIICSPLLSLMLFLKITLARITPHTGGKCKRHKKKTHDWKCRSNTGGHKRKFSIIKGARTNLGGMKKNPKDQKFWAKRKKKLYDNAQNHMKNTKAKRKSPGLSLGGTIDNFRKTFKWQKVRKQAQVILSLEIP
jgi:hypothetical protein